MLEFRKINDWLSVSPQICAGDVIEIQRAGFVAIVNNRPDGEEVNQPWNDDIEEEAKRLGIPYHYIPVINAPFASKMIEKTRLLLEIYQEQGPVLFFCRSGTRATHLWAYSQTKKTPVVELVTMAADAGYDLSKIAGALLKN